MVQRNIVIAIIIIVLFVVLTGVGFLIYYVQTGFSRMRARGSITDEEGGD
jgi:uncharacterized protein YpmB